MINFVEIFQKGVTINKKFRHSNMINIENKTLTEYKFIDLFAGMGGFRVALESFGARCVYSNEWNKYAQYVYKYNFGDMPESDITKHQ